MPRALSLRGGRGHERRDCGAATRHLCRHEHQHHMNDTWLQRQSARIGARLGSTDPQEQADREFKRYHGPVRVDRQAPRWALSRVDPLWWTLFDSRSGGVRTCHKHVHPIRKSSGRRSSPCTGQGDPRGSWPGSLSRRSRRFATGSPWRMDEGRRPDVLSSAERDELRVSRSVRWVTGPGRCCRPHPARGCHRGRACTSASGSGPRSLQ